jgi:hypothetical protein
MCTSCVGSLQIIGALDHAIVLVILFRNDDPVGGDCGWRITADPDAGADLIAQCWRNRREGEPFSIGGREMKATIGASEDTIDGTHAIDGTHVEAFDVEAGTRPLGRRALDPDVGSAQPPQHGLMIADEMHVATSRGAEVDLHHRLGADDGDRTTEGITRASLRHRKRSRPSGCSRAVDHRVVWDDGARRACSGGRDGSVEHWDNRCRLACGRAISGLA